MADKRRKGGTSGGVKGFIASAVTLLLLAGGILAWWNVNGFSDLGDVWQWLRSRSVNYQDCVQNELSSEEETANKILSADGCFYDNSGGDDASSTSGTTERTEATEAVVSAAQTTLDALTVAAAEDVNYNRSEWKHWIDVDGNCNTREKVLELWGTNVTTDPKTCKILSGTWKDLYGGGADITDPSTIDIDHVVPLSYAAQHGGQAWDAAEKEEFANDITDNLFPVSASENRSKGDSGPFEYMPPNDNFQCTYALKYINVLNKYKLTVAQDDKDKLAFVLKTKC